MKKKLKRFRTYKKPVCKDCPYMAVRPYYTPVDSPILGGKLSPPIALSRCEHYFVLTVTSEFNGMKCSKCGEVLWQLANPIQQTYYYCSDETIKEW